MLDFNYKDAIDWVESWNEGKERLFQEGLSWNNNDSDTDESEE